MGAFLSNIRYVAWTTLAIAVLFLVYYALGVRSYAFTDNAFWGAALRWSHVLSGIMWIGLLYYFNFVQTPSMPKIPDEQKPAISKVIAPEALFWFRWGAMSTLVFGLLLALMNGYLIDAILIGITDGGNSTMIGIGMWLGTIMWFNVWFVIWPNQKIALGLVDAAADAKPKAARTAGMFSRINTMLSLPMLYCMVAQQHGGLA